MDTHEAFSCLLRMQLPYGNVTALLVLQCFGKTDHSSAERLTCDVMWELACSRCHLTEMVHLLHDFTNSAIVCGLHLNRFKWTSSGFICYVVVQYFLYHVIRPEEWQKGNCFTGLYQAEINLISGTNCTRQTCDCSARVCQSYCAVWFDRKWIPWKEDVATGVRRWKWSGKIIKKGASVNEGERLQRLFLYMHICVLCLCILCVCPSLLGGEVMMMDGGQKRDWGSCA